MEKEKPRNEVVIRLLKKTFRTQRHNILTAFDVSIVDLSKRYKALLLPYGVSFLHEGQVYIYVFDNILAFLSVLYSWNRKLI